MKDTTNLVAGQRVRISGTLIYGTIAFIFSSDEVYVIWDDDRSEE